MKRNISARNNVKTFGHGDKTIMFAHGFGCDQNMWRFVTPAFEDDHKIVLFDYVGSGNSDITAYNRERYANAGGYIKDILEICEELDLRDIIFVGHSVSAMFGMLAAIKEPKYFGKLIMIGPSPCYINDGDYIGGFERTDIEELLDTMDKNYIGWANFLAPNIMQNRDRPELSEELAQSFCSTDPVIARRFAEVTFLNDNREDLKYNKIPTLILQCSEDMIAPSQIGGYMEKHLPFGKLKIMEATGHCPHLSHPEEVIKLMKEYLSTE